MPAWHSPRSALEYLHIEYSLDGSDPKYAPQRGEECKSSYMENAKTIIHGWLLHFAEEIVKVKAIKKCILAGIKNHIKEQ